MPYDIADSVPIAWDVADAAGTPVTAGTAVLTVTRPDGTTELPTVPPPSSPGQYRVTYVPTVEGRYLWRAVTTSPNTAYQDVFTVRALESTALLSLAEVKRHLNITSTTYDEEIRDFIESATEVVEAHVGPIVPRTYTSRVSGGTDTLVLPHTQVTEVLSITPTYSALTAIEVSDISIDSALGDVTRLAGGDFPRGTYDVTYTVGREHISSNWTQAAKIIVQHNWKTRLGGLPSEQGEERGYVVTGAGYLVPFKAASLMQMSADTPPMVY